MLATKDSEDSFSTASPIDMWNSGYLRSIKRSEDTWNSG